MNTASIEFVNVRTIQYPMNQHTTELNSCHTQQKQTHVSAAHKPQGRGGARDERGRTAHLAARTPNQRRASAYTYQSHTAANSPCHTRGLNAYTQGNTSHRRVAAVLGVRLQSVLRTTIHRVSAPTSAKSRYQAASSSTWAYDRISAPERHSHVK